MKLRRRIMAVRCARRGWCRLPIVSWGGPAGGYDFHYTSPCRDCGVQGNWDERPVRSTVQRWWQGWRRVS